MFTKLDHMWVHKIKKRKETSHSSKNNSLNTKSAFEVQWKKWLICHRRGEPETSIIRHQGDVKTKTFSVIWRGCIMTSTKKRRKLRMSVGLDIKLSSIVTDAVPVGCRIAVLFHGKIWRPTRERKKKKNSHGATQKARSWHWAFKQPEIVTFSKTGRSSIKITHVPTRRFQTILHSYLWKLGQWWKVIEDHSRQK